MLIALEVLMVRLFLLLFAVICGWSLTNKRFEQAPSMKDFLQTTAALQNGELMKKADKTEDLERILAEQKASASADEAATESEVYFNLENAPPQDAHALIESYKLLGQREFRKK